MHTLPYAAGLAGARYADPRGGHRLHCGEAFDVLRVPEPAGRWALRRLIGYAQPALRPGPVAREADVAGMPDGDGTEDGPAEGRGDEADAEDGAADEEPACLFFVAPGAKEDLPELLDWLDWGGIDLGLRAYGAGESIAEPSVWLHDPQAAPPEVIALLATIAECCSRRLLRRSIPRNRREAG